MQKQADFRCLVSLPNGRVHPATFWVVAHGGVPAERQEMILCEVFSFHVSGFSDGGVAERWFCEQALAHLPVVPGIALDSLMAGKCHWLPKKSLAVLKKRVAA